MCGGPTARARVANLQQCTLQSCNSPERTTAAGQKPGGRHTSSWSAVTSRLHVAEVVPGQSWRRPPARARNLAVAYAAPGHAAAGRRRPGLTEEAMRLGERILFTDQKSPPRPPRTYRPRQHRSTPWQPRTHPHSAGTRHNPRRVRLSFMHRAADGSGAPARAARLASCRRVRGSGRVTTAVAPSPVTEAQAVMTAGPSDGRGRCPCTSSCLSPNLRSCRRSSCAPPLRATNGSKVDRGRCRDVAARRDGEKPW